MDFDFTKDITMILKNAAVTFTSQADLARESSAKVLKNPLNIDPDDWGQNYEMRGQSKEFLAAAATWDKRAASANEGLLLMSPLEYADPGYMSTFKQLIVECQKAGRLKIVTELDRAVNNPMAIPLEGVPSPLPGETGNGGKFGFDEKGLPYTDSHDSRQAQLAKMPGQTIGFDEKGMPIFS